MNYGRNAITHVHYTYKYKSLRNIEIACIADLPFCNVNNVAMVTISQVHHEIKSVLQDRRTLKYEGPRMQPLPPPSMKPRYGGLRKERLITGPGSAVAKKSTNWKQFSMGIGIGTGSD